MKRIGIVEDSEDMQFIYKRMFRRIKDVEIVFQTATAEMALEELARASLDLIIVDISLPGMDGIELTRMLRARYPGLKIFIATGHDREAYESTSLEAGADAFISKGEGDKLLAEVSRLLYL
jgi:DNA-binding NarL/FixJ family response regulator